MANRKQAPEGVELSRNVFGQRARTPDGEKAAWTRRIKRWKRKALAGGTPPDDVNSYISSVMGGVGAYTRDDKGLRLWAYKAHKVLGEDATVALMTAALGYKSSDL